jgi:hypothetical protein
VAKHKVARSPVEPTFRYIESSALLSAILEHDAPALKELGAGGPVVTSALTFTEASRALIRGRVAGRLTSTDERLALKALDTFERRCSIVSITDAVLTRAGRPFPVEPIRSLDAIHLATAEILGEPPQLVTIVTRDIRIRENAEALGFAVR